MTAAVPVANYHVTLLDDTEETLFGVVFFGVQDGNLVFVRPETLRFEEPAGRPTIAQGTVPMDDVWQSEGTESVDVVTFSVEEVRSIEAEWSVLHVREPTLDDPEV